MELGVGLLGIWIGIWGLVNLLLPTYLPTYYLLFLYGRLKGIEHSSKSAIRLPVYSINQSKDIINHNPPIHHSPTVAQA